MTIFCRMPTGIIPRRPLMLLFPAVIQSEYVLCSVQWLADLYCLMSLGGACDRTCVCTPRDFHRNVRPPLTQGSGKAASPSRLWCSNIPSIWYNTWLFWVVRFGNEPRPLP